MITTETCRSGPYLTNGVSTTFVYSFRVDLSTDLIVWRTTLLDTGVMMLTEGVDYSVTGVGVDGGGTIVTPTPLAAGYKLLLERCPPATQTLDLQQGDAYLPEVVESALDKATEIGSTCLARLEDCLAKPVTSTLTPEQWFISQIAAQCGTNEYLSEIYLSNYATLALALAAAVSRTLVIDVPTSLAGNVSALGTALRFVRQGMIATSGFALSDVEMANDPSWNIFDITGGGSVTAAKTGTPGNVVWFGASNAAANDCVAAFNAALAFGGHVYFPPGSYRADSTLSNTADDQTISCGEGVTISRLAANSAATTPVMALIKNRFRLLGGPTILTENNHPTGVLRLGHSDQTTSNWNSLNWYVQRPRVVGVQLAGNIGIWIPSSQPTLGASFANYFGTLESPTVYGAGIGIQLTEMSNAHFITNPFFWHCTTACLDLLGAYANTISGGWCHTCTNGVVCLRLRAAILPSHDAIRNIIMGFHEEPGGVLSSGLSIEAGCSKNFLVLQNNCAGATTVTELDNTIHSVSMNLIPATQVNGGLFATTANLSAGPFTVANTYSFALTGTVLENQTKTAFTITLPAGLNAADVEFSLQASQSAIDCASVAKWTGKILKVAGGASVVETTKTLDKVTKGVAINTPTALGSVITATITAEDNGTAKTYAYDIYGTIRARLLAGIVVA